MPEIYVNSDAVNLWACTSGQGLPMILCNGGRGSGCCDYLEPVAGLMDNVAQVIRFEQRGYGRLQK